jgi:hypothetical protein
VTINVNGWSIALLSQEGSVIAKQSHEGWFQSRNAAGFRFGTNAAPVSRWPTPPDSGGEFLLL